MSSGFSAFVSARRAALAVAVCGALLAWVSPPCREAAAAPRTIETGPLTDAEFEKLYQQVRAPEVETWRTIPWKSSLAEAVRIAHAEKKPVLLIATNGHLLGCG